MKHKTKKFIYNIVVILLLITGISWVFSRFIHLGRVEYTDNAQIRQLIVPVNSRVQGFIDKICFDEYRPVRKGDTLALIEDTEFRFRVAQAEADYQNALSGKSAMTTTINTTQNNLAVSDAGLEEARIRMDNAQREYQRYKNLYEKAAVTHQQYDAVKTDYEALKARYELLSRQKQSTALIKQEQTQRLEQNMAGIKLAKAALELAKLNLSYTVITAPCDGTTGRKNIQEGQLIQPGQTLVDIVDANDIWIVANYKETQTANIREGQSVEIEVDAVPGIRFEGVVKSISRATGASFSLFPQDKPTLGNVKNIVIGIRNPQGESSKGERSAEVWVNELRLSDFDNKGGWAANARITAKLADVATISFAGSRMTPGFGSIEQHAAEIEREDFRSIDFSTSVEFGKFFPERWRLRIPMYYAYSRQSTLPEYDPLDSDIPLEVALDNAANRHLRDSIKRNAEDYVMRKSLNFTNVGIESKDGKSHFFDWSNLSLTYSYNKSFARNVNLERDLEKNYRGLISYIYNGMPPIVEPFKKSKSKTLNSKYLRLIKDFNFYYMPSMFSITSDITRNYREVKSKNLDNPNLLIEPTYDKDFMWTRDYAFKFNLTRNLVVDFHATTQARIDEPEGIVDRQRDPERYQQWKDTVWNNILDGGRPVNYNHDFSVQYTVPVNKLPFLDWTSLQLGYSTRYDWQAAAVTADSTNLGNVIRNASALQMNGDLSLREMIRPPRKQRGKNVKFETGMDKVQKGKPVVVRHRLKTGDIQARLTAADGKNIKLGYESVGRNKIRINSSETLEGGKLLVTGTETPHAGVGNAVARFFVGILTGFKTLSVGYSEDKGTTLPGFLPEARWLGQQSYNGSSAPGFKFLFGG